MTQVVVQDFELEGIPQARPRAAEYPIHKLAPQLTKSSFDLLPDLTEEEAVSRGAVPSDQQHCGLFRQVRGALRATIAQVGQGDATPHQFDQRRGRLAVIVITGRQEDIEDPPVNVTEQMELETKEPAFTAFPKVGPVLAQQP